MEIPFDFDNHPQFVAIVGSREWKKRHWIEKFVDQLQSGTVVVSGGAKGADTFAQTAAIARRTRHRDMEFKVFPVDEFEWKVVGKRAGHIRNEILVLYMKLVKGHVVVFALEDAHGNLTGGSTNVITNCIKYNVPYTVYRQPKEGS